MYFIIYLRLRTYLVKYQSKNCKKQKYQRISNIQHPFVKVIFSVVRKAPIDSS